MNQWLTGLSGQSPYAQSLMHPTQLVAPRAPMAAPKYMGGAPGFPDIYDRNVRDALALAGAVNQAPQGSMPNMGKAQGGPDNYFHEAQGNSPFIHKPSMPSASSPMMIPRKHSPGFDDKTGKRIDYSRRR